MEKRERREEGEKDQSGNLSLSNRNLLKLAKKNSTLFFLQNKKTLLSSRYSYDPPTGAFPLAVFKQAFAAVQASVVHLQGVPTSRRFALVPMGPPLLSYSSDCRALLRWEPSSDPSSESKGSVVLDVDRDVRKGDPVVAW